MFVYNLEISMSVDTAVTDRLINETFGLHNVKKVKRIFVKNSFWFTEKIEFKKGLKAY